MDHDIGILQNGADGGGDIAGDLLGALKGHATSSPMLMSTK